MYIAALFAIVTNWKHPTCSLLGGCLRKLWPIHRPIHSGVHTRDTTQLERNELLVHSAIWMDLKGIMVSEKKSIPKRLYTT